MKRKFLLLGLFQTVVAAAAIGAAETVAAGAVRPRVVVSTDIGGTDPDDFQSMVHLLLCADDLDLEGLISSPYGPGRRGGTFVRAWEGRRVAFPRITSAGDHAEIFSVVEFAVPLPVGMTRAHTARVIFDNRIPAAVVNDGAALRFRFAPRDAKVWTYVIRSDFAPLDGTKGEFTAFPLRGGPPSAIHPHWWTDDPAPDAAEGIHAGARTVSRWREEFLRDFARRLARCEHLP